MCTMLVFCLYCTVSLVSGAIGRNYARRVGEAPPPPLHPSRNFRCPLDEPEWPELFYKVQETVRLTQDARFEEARLGMAYAIGNATADLPKAFNCSIGISSAYRVLALAYAGDNRLERTNPRAYRRLLQVSLRFFHVSMNWLTHAFVVKGVNDGHWVDDSDWPITIQEMNDEQTAIQNTIERGGPHGHFPSWNSVPLDYKDPNTSIGIVTMCDYPPDNVLPRYSMSNKDIYSSRHGYEVIAEHKRIDEGRPHAWAKIALLEKHIKLKKHDWLLWFDCDSYFMNLNITLDYVLYKYASLKKSDGSRALDPSVHMIVQEDHAMLNTGVFFVRTTPWAAKLMAKIYGDSSSPWIHHPWWENAAFSHEFLGRPDRAVKMAKEDPVDFIKKMDSSSHRSDLHDIYPSKVRVVPQVEINSYHPITSRLYQHDTWEPGKFVLAFSGCTQGSSPTVMQLVYGNYYRTFCELNHVEDRCLPVEDPSVFPWARA